MTEPVTSWPTSCPFCAIIAGRAHGEIVYETPLAFGLVPLEPVTPGHTLIIPKMHVRSFSENPNVAAATMLAAAEFAAGITDDVNVITSRGPLATQTVHHLHLHVIPRRLNDALPLPWDPAPRPPEDVSVRYLDGTHIACTVKHEGITHGWAASGPFDPDQVIGMNVGVLPAHTSVRLAHPDEEDSV